MTANRENPNPHLSPPSAEELAFHADPRIRAMNLPAANKRYTERVLEPSLPIPGPSRFLYARTPYGGRMTNRITQVSPKGLVHTRGGCGFAPYIERPRWVQNTPPPSKPPMVWQDGDFLIVSPEVRAIFCRRDAASIEFCEIDWEYRDGSRLEGYGLLDVIRLVHAYDYARSRVDVHLYQDGRIYLSLWRDPTVLRTDIPADIHFFREARSRKLFISRELASELAPYAAKDLEFESPHGLSERVELVKHRKRVFTEEPPAPAIVHQLPFAAEPADAGLQRRISNEIVPLLDACQFAQAEERLAGWMSALTEGPWHVAITPGMAITTPPSAVASLLNAFVAEAAKQQKPKALYAEMNGFDINPDEWFFSVFAFVEDGGREEFDWLGDFYASTDERCIITGLEALQAVYQRWMSEGAAFPHGHDGAREIANTLVIVRFQRLLQEALALTRIRVPLLASAHDCAELTIEIG